MARRSFVVSTNPESMKSAAMSLDLILNTVSANHQVKFGHDIIEGLQCESQNLYLYPDLILNTVSTNHQVKIGHDIVKGQQYESQNLHSI